jgi:hypothetical protein
MKLLSPFSGILLAVLCGTALKAQVQPVTVKGKIIDSVEKTAAAGVAVKLESKKDSAISYHTITDSAGNFELPGVTKDTFLFSIHMSGYPSINKIWIVTDSSVDAGTIAISKENAAGNNNNQITQTSTSVTGILQDKADKTPLYGATVNIRLKKDSAIQHNVVSDNKGFFSFSVIPVDTVILSVSSIGYEFVDQQFYLSDTANNLGIILIPKTSKQL